MAPGCRTDPGNEIRKGAPLDNRGTGHQQILTHLLDEGGAPEDPLIPLVRLPTPAECGNGGPSSLTSEETAALELWPPALWNPSSDEEPVRAPRARQAGPKPGENLLGSLPGPGGGSEEGAMPCPGVAIEGPEIEDDMRAKGVQV